MGGAAGHRSWRRTRGALAPRCATLGSSSRARSRGSTASSTATCCTAPARRPDRARDANRSRRHGCRGARATEREFSERDRDAPDVANAGLEDALRATRRASASPARSPTVRHRVSRSCCSTAPARSSSEPRRRALAAEHFGAAEHPAWLPGPIAERRHRRRAPRLSASATVGASVSCPCPAIRTPSFWRRRSRASSRTRSDRLSLTARETEVLRAAAVIQDEAEIAWGVRVPPPANGSRASKRSRVRTATGRCRPGAARKRLARIHRSGRCGGWKRLAAKLGCGAGLHPWSDRSVEGARALLEPWVCRGG